MVSLGGISNTNQLSDQSGFFHLKGAPFYTRAPFINSP